MFTIPHHTTKHYGMVRRFMQLAKQTVPNKPTEPSAEDRILRAKLIYEEALETINKGLGVSVLFTFKESVSFPNSMEVSFLANMDFNMAELVDGCCDLKVVTTGTLVACGVPDGAFQQIVDQNNLDKFGPGHTFREDGKLIKPPNHQPPPIAEYLQQLESRSEQNDHA